MLKWINQWKNLRIQNKWKICAKIKKIFGQYFLKFVKEGIMGVVLLLSLKETLI